MPTDRKSKKCLVPECGRPRVSRGMCAGCRATADRNVEAGLTTWEELFHKGWALPPYAKEQSRAPLTQALVKHGMISSTPETPAPK